MCLLLRRLVARMRGAVLELVRAARIMACETSTRTFWCVWTTASLQNQALLGSCRTTTCYRGFWAVYAACEVRGREGQVELRAMTSAVGPRRGSVSMWFWLAGLADYQEFGICRGTVCRDLPSAVDEMERVSRGCCSLEAMLVEPLQSTYAEMLQACVKVCVRVYLSLSTATQPSRQLSGSHRRCFTCNTASKLTVRCDCRLLSSSSPPNAQRNSTNHKGGSLQLTM
jgi:hypothetical protein